MHYGIYPWLYICITNTAFSNNHNQIVAFILRQMHIDLFSKSESGV